MTDMAKGLPDWAKLFLPMILTLLIAAAAWAVQWGKMSSTMEGDRAAIIALQAQVSALAGKVEGFGGAMVAVQANNAQDERRLNSVERSIDEQRRDREALAGQMGEMRALLTTVRDDQRALRLLIEGQYRRQGAALGVAP